MATKKKKKANKTSRPKNKKDRRTIPRDIKGLVLLFSGIFILFFLFASNSGAVGAWISEMLKLAIGKAGYFLGILLVAAGILKMVRYSPHVEK
ncbi:MAG TPA: hypothetical protein DHN33_00220, partial [Eubacteriaceae bacterium]|nr:hypothetical protein [Eubacteriaceae bacterium]